MVWGFEMLWYFLLNEFWGFFVLARLGSSGLKVSRIILGTGQYGHKGWQEWVIDDEDEACRHIKFAYVLSNCFTVREMVSEK